jgi:hypothetical protein
MRNISIKRGDQRIVRVKHSSYLGEDAAPKQWNQFKTDYVKDNIVEYQGVIYIALSSVPTGTIPTDVVYWLSIHTLT